MFQSIRLHNNISANFVNRMLSKNQADYLESATALSTSYRINNFRDDIGASGFAERLKSVAYGLSQSNNNVQEGYSLLQITTGALESVNSIMQKIRNLALQAADGTITDADRANINSSATILGGEVDLITSSATFNGINLLRPDTKIVYTSNDDGNWNVYSIDSDGTDKKQLTNTSEVELFPSLSPNGTQVVFQVKDVVGNIELGVVDVDGSNYRKLTSYGQNTITPTWTSDGNSLIFSSNKDGNGYEIYRWDVSISGSTPYKLTTHAGLYNDRYPSISPDGSKIAFSSTYDDGTNGGDEIYVMNSDGSNITRLTNFNSGAAPFYTSTAPKWSPDSSKIMFMNYSTVATNGEIMIMNSDGSNITNFTNTGGINDRYADYSPYGENFLYDSFQGGSYDIYSKNAIDNLLAPSQITSTGFNEQTASWSIDDDSNVEILAGFLSSDVIKTFAIPINSQILGLNSIDLSTQSGAAEALDLIDKNIKKLNDFNTVYSSMQNRFQYVLKYNEIAQTNNTSALSRVIDTDYATEMVRNTKSQIIMNADMALTSQANYLNKGVLDVLFGGTYSMSGGLSGLDMFNSNSSMYQDSLKRNSMYNSMTASLNASDIWL